MSHDFDNRVNNFWSGFGVLGSLLIRGIMVLAAALVLGTLIVWWAL